VQIAPVDHLGSTEKIVALLLMAEVVQMVALNLILALEAMVPHLVRSVMWCEPTGPHLTME